MTTVNIASSNVTAIRLAGTWYAVAGLTPFILRGIFDGQPGYRFGGKTRDGANPGTYVVTADKIESVHASTVSGGLRPDSPSTPGDLTVEAGQVQRVLIAGGPGLTYVTDMESCDVAGPFASLSGFRVALDPEKRVVQYVRRDDLVAVQGKSFIQSDAELAEARAEAEEAADLAFQHEHYVDRQTFETALAAQEGFCGKCRATLAGVPHTHYYEATKTVLCPSCSPLKQRFGTSR